MRCLTRRDVDAVHVEIFVDRQACCSCPPESGCGRRSGVRASPGSPAARARIRCTRSIRPGRSSSTARAERTLGRALRGLGPAARTAAAALVRGPRAGVPQRARVARRSAAGAARAPRFDRARDRRLRAAARALSVPGGPVRLGRPAGLIALGLAAAACGSGGGSGSPAPPTVAPAKRVHARLAGPEDGRRAREGHAAVRGAHAGREGADAVPHGRGPAHGRARDHRARRSVLDHPQAPAGPGERPPRAARHPPARRPLPRAGRRLSGCGHRAAQLPAHARPAGRQRAT